MSAPYPFYSSYGDKHVQTFPGRYDEIQKICQFVADGAAECGLDPTAVFTLSWRVMKLAPM